MAVNGQETALAIAAWLHGIDQSISPLGMPPMAYVTTRTVLKFLIRKLESGEWTE